MIRDDFVLKTLLLFIQDRNTHFSRLNILTPSTANLYLGTSYTGWTVVQPVFFVLFRQSLIQNDYTQQIKHSEATSVAVYNKCVSGWLFKVGREAAELLIR